MEDMDELEQICFEIISYVGTAKSCYVNSIAKAKEGDFATAAELVKQGDEAYNGGHEVHMKLLQAEASGAGMKTLPLLLLHAEGRRCRCSSSTPRIRWRVPRPASSWR